MPTLIVLNGPLSGTQCLVDGPTTIGRSSSADLCLPDPLVSGAHARIVTTPEGWQLLDSGSTNGTLVAGLPVVDVMGLSLGDVLTLGSTRLLFTKSTERHLPATGVAASLVSEEDYETVRLVVLESPTDERLYPLDLLAEDRGEGMELPLIDALQRELSRATHLDGAVARVALTFTRAVGASRVAVFLKENGTHQPVWLGKAEDGLVAPMEAADFPLRIDVLERSGASRGFILTGAPEVTESKEPEAETAEHTLPLQAPSTALCLALPAGVGVIGLIYLHGLSAFPAPSDLRLLLVMATLAGANLREKQLVQRVRGLDHDLRRRDQELSLTRELLGQDEPSSGGSSLVQVLADHRIDAVVTTTLEGQVTSWNSGAERLYGHSAKEVLGETLPTVPDARGPEFERVLGAVANGRTLSMRTQRMASDGRSLDVDATYAPILAGDAVVGLVEIGRDLGPRLREEERLRHAERHASFSELAATLAHELGNPLANLGSGVDYLLSRPREAEVVRESLQTLREEIDRLHRLTTQTLELARWRLPTLGVVDVDELFDYAATIHGARAAEVEVHRAKGKREFVRGDLDQLKQVVFNLTANAISVMPAGGVLEFDVEREGGEVILLVGDTGPGIAADDRERIFDPFFSTRGGQGIGLAVVRRIAQLHGGSVSVESSPGAGATFFVRLPAPTHEECKRALEANR